MLTTKNTLLKYVIVLLFIVPIPFSCNTEIADCACPNPTYSIGDLSSVSVEGSLGATDTVDVDQVIIPMLFTINSLIGENREEVGSFWNQAYACTCVPKDIVEEINGITIQSSGSFGDDYPAGTDLLALFRAEVNFGTDNTNLPISLLYEDDEEVPEFGINRLGLVDAEPADSSIHKFSMTIDLNDGRSFEGETAYIRYLQ